MLRSATARFAGSFGNVFFSLVFGALAMGLFWYHLPDEFVQLQRSAAVAREWIAALAWSKRTESIIRFLLDERQLLLISFVLVVRLLLGIAGVAFRSVTGLFRAG